MVKNIEQKRKGKRMLKYIKKRKALGTHTCVKKKYAKLVFL